MTSTDAATGERADLLSALATQRYFLRYTARDLTDEQAAQRTTVSALCVGGAIKHVTYTERQWAQFIVVGPSAMASDESDMGPTWTDSGCWRGRRWPGCWPITTRWRSAPTT